MSNKIIEGANEATRKRNPQLFGHVYFPETQKSAEDLSAVPKDERELHDQFERWLRVHEKGPIPYVHSRMDRKSTIREGWPDFSVHWKGKSAFVEFKMPGKTLTEEQLKVCREIDAAGNPVMMCHAVVDAIEFVREKLGL